MGISHLQTYLHKHKNKSTFCMDVSIKDLVANFKSETKSDNVTLVVDGNCFLYEQYDFKKYDWCMGGQLLAWTEQVDNFIKKFQDLGVRLVFFFDGSITESKINLWISRQQDSVVKHNKIFCWLKDSANTDLSYESYYESEATGNTALLPAMIGACGRFLLKYYFKCEVHVSVDDCDREMAKFAHDNKCFAIMSQDTDFLVFEGARYYLSIRYFNLDEMKTICYNGEQLASSLSLQINQLPLFASLIGNDYVSLYDLRKFHQKICGPSERNFENICVKVPHVADFVRKQPTGQALIKDLSRISGEVFGRGNMAFLLETSLKSYKTGRDNTLKNHKFWSVLDAAYQKHVNCEIPPTLYSMLLGKPYELKMSLEDFSSGLPSAAVIYLPLRLKMYSILLHDIVSRDRSCTVEEWCVLNEDMRNIPQHISFICENDSLHPGLEKLWTGNAEMNSVRWKIFAKSISPKLFFSDLQKIPLEYVIPAVTLHFLLNKGKVLRNYEVHAFITQVILMKHSTVDDLKAMETPTTPSARMVHISTVIGRGITTVLLLMASCGFSLENVMPWLYFDGRLFQKQYISAEKRETKLKLLNNRKELLPEFELIRSIAYNGKLRNKCSSGKKAASKTSVSVQQSSRQNENAVKEQNKKAKGYCNKEPKKQRKSQKESKATLNVVSNESHLFVSTSGTLVSPDIHVGDENSAVAQQSELQTETKSIKRKRNRNRKKKSVKQNNNPQDFAAVQEITDNVSSLSL